MIVVSEIGEQWSPQTAPAIQAEIAMIIRVLLMSPLKISTTIGMSRPNVPQEVPVENAMNTAIAKMIAGRKFIHAPALALTTEAM